MRRTRKLLVPILLLILSGLLLIPTQPVHGTIPFQTTWGGKNNDIAQSVTVDATGNIYVTGDTNSFGGNTQTHLFLLKLNATGNITWSRLWSGNGGDHGKGVAVDSAGNVYVVGYTPGAGGANDLLLLKFDSAGNLLWQRTCGGIYDTLGQSVAIDASGNIYTAGYTDNTASGQPNAILIKFNSTGNVVWQQSWGGNNATFAQGVAVDSQGNITETGGIFTQSNGIDVFVLKFLSDGTFGWQRTWGGSQDDMGYAVATDPYDNILVTGYTSSSGAGASDAFILKLNSEGVLTWAKTWGGANTDIGQGISVDSLGYVYVTGLTQSFGSGGGKVFVLALDGSGGLRWQTLWGGNGYDSAYAAAVAGNGYVIVTGLVSELPPYSASPVTGSFSAAGGKLTTTKTPAASLSLSTGAAAGTVSQPVGSTSYGGAQDAFILKYGAPTPPSAPQNLVANGYVGYVGLTWTAPAFNGFSSITGYNVYQVTAQGLKLVASIGNVTSYNNTGLLGGVSYKYQVNAINIYGEGAASNQASAIPVSVPTAPQKLLAISGIRSAQLNWTVPKSDGGSALTGYNIYRGTASGAESLIAQIGIQKTYIDSPLTGGVTYYYYVTAVNSIGQSLPSNEASTIPTSSPSPPQSLQGIPSAGTVLLAWNTPASSGGSPITGYNVYRGAFSGGESRIAQLQNVLTYTDATVAPNTIYYYYVTAVNVVGESLPSNEVNVNASSSPNTPTAPRNLIATAGKNSVMLNWTIPLSNRGSEITGYDIWRGVAANSISFLTLTGNQTFFNDTGLTPGTTYFYAVAARNALGEGPLSNTMSATPFTNPSAPLNLEAFKGLNESILTWSPPSYNGASEITGYRIYRGLTSGGESFLTQIGNQTSFIDKAVTPGTEYFYTITAVNAAGESPQSLEVSATPSQAPVPPSPPQTLVATAGNGTVTLTWSAPLSNGGAMITGYEIWKGPNTGTETFFQQIGNVTTFTDNNLLGGNPYFYQVKAINDASLQSSLSNEASATPTSVPSAPLNLVATAGNNQVTLSWTTPAGNGGLAITGYNIYRATSSGSEVFLTTIGASPLSYIDTTASYGQTYYYRVAAINVLGQSKLSSEASAAPFTVPSQPLNPMATAGTNQVTLNWTTPSSNGGLPVKGYLIYRGTSSGAETLLFNITNANQLSYIDTTATFGQTYYYQIYAYNAAGQSNPSAEVSATPKSPVTKPQPPTSVTATPGINSITITWSPPANNGGSAITGYELWRGTSPGSEVRYKILGIQTSYTDTQVAPGTTYYYYVLAVNSVGKSDPSQVAHTSPLSPPPPVQTPPNQPTNLAATITSSRTVNLTWSIPAPNSTATPITGYDIYRGTSSGSEIKIDSVGNVTSYIDISATAGKTYFYEVRAVNSIGQSAPSNEVSIPVPSPPSGFPIIPVAIAALVIVAVGALSVIFWRRRVSQRMMMPP